jgi:tetratricopeptide (TPR) repeat protein
MKAERRHELVTNELADWIANFPQWFKENQTTIIVATVIVAGLIAYTIFFYSRQGSVWEQKQALTTALLDQLRWQKETVLEGKVQGLGVSDIFLNTAGSLQSAAAETENPLLSALAMIKRAEALRTELHYRPKAAEPDVQKYQLEQAKTIYEQALEKAKGSPEIAAMAEYGIALCLEDMGDFEGAQKLYEKIADSAEYQGGSFAARAKFRAKTLNNNKEKVFFSQVQKPEIKQPVEQQVSEPLKPEAPSTGTDVTSQKDLDFNLAK